MDVGLSGKEEHGRGVEADGVGGGGGVPELDLTKEALDRVFQVGCVGGFEAVFLWEGDRENGKKSTRWGTERRRRRVRLSRREKAVAEKANRVKARVPVPSRQNPSLGSLRSSESGRAMNSACLTFLMIVSPRGDRTKKQERGPLMSEVEKQGE